MLVIINFFINIFKISTSFTYTIKVGNSFSFECFFSIIILCNVIINIVNTFVGICNLFFGIVFLSLIFYLSCSISNSVNTIRGGISYCLFYFSCTLCDFFTNCIFQIISSFTGFLKMSPSRFSNSTITDSRTYFSCDRIIYCFFCNISRDISSSLNNFSTSFNKFSTSLHCFSTDLSNHSRAFCTHLSSLFC